LAEILGKVEKPAAGKFLGMRKLYLVPLVFSGKDAPGDYREKVALYWQQADEQLDNLEKRIGRVRKIYHESLTLGGDEGLKLVERFNEDGFPLVKKRCALGAELVATEDMELFARSLDWGNCLRVVMSREVFQKVSEFYREASESRFEYISRRIADTLGEQEAGALFISEGHSVQFPPTMQVFYVSPPALDDIHHWFRERAGAQEQPEKAE
jgi:hypothetical protein